MMRLNRNPFAVFVAATIGLLFVVVPVSATVISAETIQQATRVLGNLEGTWEQELCYRDGSCRTFIVEISRIHDFAYRRTEHIGGAGILFEGYLDFDRGDQLIIRSEVSRAVSIGSRYFSGEINDDDSITFTGLYSSSSFTPETWRVSADGSVLSVERTAINPETGEEISGTEEFTRVLDPGENYWQQFE